MKPVSVLILLASLVVATPTQAQQPGTYFLSVGTMTVGADGKITVSQTALTLVRVGENPTPPSPPAPPQPPQPPQPPIPTQTRSQQIQAVAESATADPSRQETAATLAALYGMINDQVKAKKLTGQDVIAKGLAASDQFAIPKGATAANAWKPYQAKFASLWTEQVQTNADDGELAKLIDETVVGLKAAAPTYNAEPPTIEQGGKTVDNPRHLAAQEAGLKALNWAAILKFFVEVVLPMLLQLMS